MQKEDYKVDIVVPWVDGSDREWLQEKNKYLPKEKQIDIDVGINRYRDWDNVKYIFRGIEKFCPWVNKVYFITCGQKPKWLNEKCEKLVLVNHKDYIPNEYLPTFSSRPIELNIYKIKGLSEHFVYINDDFFFTKMTSVSDFFIKGLPRLVAMEKPKTITTDKLFDSIVANDIRLILSRFDKKATKKAHRQKWYTLKNPVAMLVNIFYDVTARTGWAGFYMDHLPTPFLKSKIAECWDIWGDKLTKVTQNRFRTGYDINQYLFTEYLLCTGCFYPDRYKRKGKLINLRDDEESNVDYACRVIRKQKYKMICINDSDIQHFEETKNQINASLDAILPDKSSFEL